MASNQESMIDAVVAAAKDAGVEGTSNLVSFALAFKTGHADTNASKLAKENAALKAKILALETATAAAPAAKASSGGVAEEKACTVGKPPLDIALFKDPKLAETVRESQRRRYWVDKLEHIEADTDEEKLKIQDGYRKQQAANVALVDQVIESHAAWVKERYEYDQLKRGLGKINKEMGKLMKAKKFEEAKKVKAQAIEAKAGLPAKEQICNDLLAVRDGFMCKIGNVCPSDRGMVWTRDEDLSPTPDGYHWGVGIDTKGVATADARRNTAAKPETILNHVDLCHRLNIRDTDTQEAGGPAEGVKVAGNRAFFLKGDGVSLNQALINYGLAFLENKGYTQLQTPYFINRSKMGLCAQLEDFDEQLYKVSDGSGEPKYLIATSEQAICCYHENKKINKKKLPMKFAGYSTCFRKEVGSHGRDTLGIFRVHQFEKVEQFCITEPDKSWEMMEQMIGSSMDFYRSLEIPFKVINIVSGELNNAAAQKYDLEAWFPASRTFRELVSCSNCLDYQSRRVQCKVEGGKKGKEFVHMLNSTLTATERTLCCIIENYQTDKGVNVPKVLQPYMPNGKSFIPFVQALPKAKKSKKGKKSKK